MYALVHCKNVLYLVPVFPRVIPVVNVGLVVAALLLRGRLLRVPGARALPQRRAPQVPPAARASADRV